MNTRTTVILLTGLLLSATGLFADEIPVINGSFEDTTGVTLLSCAPPSPCEFSIGPFPGWLTSGVTASGLLQPGPPTNQTLFSFVPDGITTGYDTGGTILSETVGATVVDGFIYTMTVQLGSRFDFGFGSSADVLLSGLNGNVIVPAMGTPPVPGGWSEFTATFTGSVATAGDSITIQLNSSGPGIQGNFDNVHLSFVPEPGYMGLFGLGLAGLLAIRLNIAYFSRRRTAQ